MRDASFWIGRTLQKDFHIQNGLFVFSNLPTNLKLVLQIGGRLVIAIANHLDQSFRNKEAAIWSYLLHASLAGVVVTVCCGLTSLSELCTHWIETIFLSQLACFAFSSSNLHLQRNILSTGEICFITNPTKQWKAPYTLWTVLYKPCPKVTFIIT